MRVGAEVPGETGEVGLAAEAQIVVDRADLLDENLKGRIKPGPAPSPASTWRCWPPWCSTRRLSASWP